MAVSIAFWEGDMNDAPSGLRPKAIPDYPPAWPDQRIWDIFLSPYHMAALGAANELGLFDALAAAPASDAEIAERMDLELETLKALLPLLAALGFLRVRDGRYAPTAYARTYLLTDSPYYWGHAFAVHSGSSVTQQVLHALRQPERDKQLGAHAQGWESGSIDEQMGLSIADFMNSHSVPASLAIARMPRFAGVKHVLDVGGGSGCFSIALARANPGLRATIMELPSMCRAAQHYIDGSGVADVVDTRAVDMFRQPWPTGHDAVFFANVFHDWSYETNRDLAAKSYASLPSGGTIHLHEMLINDDGSGPLYPACFSMMMRVGTRGRQYAGKELTALLQEVGFADVEIDDSYGYYSLVSARKP
jgi:acetylserotonin N-methyltransferase